MKKQNLRKLFAGLSSACVVAASMPLTTVVTEAADPASAILYGDANNDGEVNMADAVLIMQSLANPDVYGLGKPDGITATGQDLADVDERGNGITNSDALIIQEYKLGLRDTLPASWAQGQTPDTSTTTTTTTTTGGEVDPVTDPTYIHLLNNSIRVEGNYAEVNGTTVTITHSGEFYIDGTLDDGQINVNVADETADAETVKIFLNGVNITGKSAPAILITNAENTSINLMDGTQNVISDGDTAYSGDNLGAAVIEAKDDLTIKGGTLGTGVLDLTANTQDGIVCNNDIKINGGIINVTTLNATDETNGINGKTSLTVKGGILTVEAEGDGIKSSKGAVTVSGGTTTIKAGNDAVQAETTIDISAGTLIAGGDRGLTAVTGVNITGGTVLATATDNQAAGVTSANQAAMLLNCIDDASNTDGMWKKANAISVGSLSFEKWTKKYKYVLVSDPSVKAGQTYTLTNASTGAVVTYNNDAADSFNVTNSVTTFENVNPAGKDGSSTVVTPSTDGYTITLSGSSISVNAPADVASVKGGVLTISKEGTFAVTGEGSGTQIVVDVDKTAYPNSVVELDLMGMSLTNTNTAPIYVASIGDEVQIVAKSGTTNTISDGTAHTQTYTDSDGNTNYVEGAIFARDDIKFKGTGTLTVNGNQDDAIVCKNDIKIYNGTLNVNAVDDGIRGKDSVTIGDTTKSDGSAADNSNLKLTVKTTGSGDGIKATATDTATDKAYGTVTINGGTIDITSYADGIQAEQEFIMNDGTLNIYTYQGSSYGGSSTSTGTTDPWSSSRPGSGGGMGQDGNANKVDISAKGIKAVGLYDEAGTTWQSKGNLTINGGKVTIDSSDDAIHCGGDMFLYGGNMVLATADDGAHSDHQLTIGKGSAATYDDVTIRITKGYEGIEAQQIVQNSGAVICNVTDDGFNAGGGSDGSGNGNQFGPGQGWGQGTTTGSGSYSLTFNGGFARVNVASGDHDGFDSNGTITINDGILITNGNEPFDSNNGVTVKGGIYIEDSASGGNYMDAQPSYSVTGSTTSAGQRISLVNNSGKVIVSFIAGKNVSTLRAGGNVSGASFKIGGNLSGSTYFIDGEQAAYGGTVS